MVHRSQNLIDWLIDWVKTLSPSKQYFSHIGTPPREREGERNEELGRLKGPYFHPNLKQMKQITSWQHAKYDSTLPLKAAAKNAPSHHPRTFNTES